ncbi:hypothetical protein GJT99_01445 [Enterobacteriaceae endosymbiont of Donacia cincticornis]|uniref:hypothetical protein n=1 Tax=Enterobacteriaceae endosymbiont of Donacia cincticornis TaxID=2675773 RepID=UPI001449B9F5|nr:hypothetical protein [Enterobacteriaceae endosymbiont of Donacia cincticornis]QJC36173.1 hypothetical protein GJT99_01445 [Enterobacteriaceae endosymbiont of Donacia cincticornis]
MNKKLLSSFYKEIYNKKYYCYIVAGNEFFFLKKNLHLLFNKLLSLNYIKNNVIIIDNDTNWENIFLKFTVNDFFCKKKVIHLLFLKKDIFLQFRNYILFLLRYIDINNILVLEIHDNINYNIEKILKNITDNNNGFFLKNIKLNSNQLLNWIYLRFKKLNLFVDKEIISILKNSYSQNLTLLNQVINDFFIQKKNYNCKNNLIYRYDFNNLIILKENKFIDFILLGDLKKSLKLIIQMKNNKQNIFLILNKLQKNIFLILELYRNYQKKSINLIFKKFLIPTIRQKIFIKILNRINSKKLYLIIKLLLEIEINLKSFIIKNYIEKYCWIDLERLILLMS